MKWTTDKPTLQTAKHGEFYWFKGTFDTSPDETINYKSPTVLELHSNGHQLFAKQLGVTWWTDVNTSDGVWAGPLEPHED